MTIASGAGFGVLAVSTYGEADAVRTEAANVRAEAARPQPGKAEMKF